ncbi:MAG: hypothetical protein JWN34_5986 [Bryobacterales bacterium]|nr:hypothetical protein [Bryobacterales bacterium]
MRPVAFGRICKTIPPPWLTAAKPDATARNAGWQQIVDATARHTVAIVVSSVEGTREREGLRNCSRELLLPLPSARIWERRTAIALTGRRQVRAAGSQSMVTGLDRPKVNAAPLVR